MEQEKRRMPEASRLKEIDCLDHLFCAPKKVSQQKHEMDPVGVGCYVASLWRLCDCRSVMCRG